MVSQLPVRAVSGSVQPTQAPDGKELTFLPAVCHHRFVERHLIIGPFL